MTLEVAITTDISYGPDERHVFDLCRPEGVEEPPIVVYLHGGGFVRGDKSAPEGKARIAGLASRGVAVAAANYRLAPGATYPAQILDAKTLVCFLRSNGSQWGVATGKVGIWGVSAGGYIASMVGLTDGDPELSPPDGNTKVDAVASWFAPLALRATMSRSWVEQIVLGDGPETAMLGEQDDESRLRLAEQASPVNRVHPDAPPFLLAHGDQDKLVNSHQSQILHEALTLAGASSTLVYLGGEGHEGVGFDEPQSLAMTAAFFATRLE
jgi:acetyl esterase/lipase